VVGLVSDTHGLLRPEAVAALGGATLIVHAGDVGAPEVLAALARIAPVVAVRGNNDRGAWARQLPVMARRTVDGCRMLVVHDRRDVPARLDDVDVIVWGHSHRPSVERVGDVLFVNPGSAGPRRFTLPVTVGRLRPGRPPEADIVALVVPAAARPA